MIQNEKGSTLVVVLLIISVVAVFGTTLFGSNLNSAKQAQQTESTIRATHLAEMGITYRTKEIQHILIEQKIPSLKDIDLTLFDTTTIDVDSESHYTVSPPQWNSKKDKLIFDSIGSDKGKEKRLSVTISSSNGNDNTDGDGSNNGITFTEIENIKPDGFKNTADIFYPATNYIGPGNTRYNNIAISAGTATFNGPIEIYGALTVAGGTTIDVKGTLHATKSTTSTKLTFTGGGTSFIGEHLLINNTNGISLNSSNLTVNNNLFINLQQKTKTDLTGKSLLKVKENVYFRVIQPNLFQDMQTNNYQGGTICTDGTLQIAYNDELLINPGLNPSKKPSLFEQQFISNHVDMDVNKEKVKIIYDSTHDCTKGHQQGRIYVKGSGTSSGDTSIFVTDVKYH